MVNEKEVTDVSKEQLLNMKLSGSRNYTFRCSFFEGDCVGGVWWNGLSEAAGGPPLRHF
jgi:hypothetical protein